MPTPSVLPTIRVSSTRSTRRRTCSWRRLAFRSGRFPKTAASGYHSEIDFEFVSPVEAGDAVTIELTPEVGDRSVRFDYTATCDGTVAFEGYEQRVCAEHGGGGAIEVPGDLRDAMAAYVDS